MNRNALGEFMRSMMVTQAYPTQNMLLPPWEIVRPNRMTKQDLLIPQAPNQSAKADPNVLLKWLEMTRGRR